MIVKYFNLNQYVVVYHVIFYFYWHDIFSKINHKVKFELDEDGVEGAAAANVEISFRNLAR